MGTCKEREGRGERRRVKQFSRREIVGGRESEGEKRSSAGRREIYGIIDI